MQHEGSQWEIVATGRGRGTDSVGANEAEHLAGARGGQAMAAGGGISEREEQQWL
jgi:hypothetical protein